MADRLMQLLADMLLPKAAEARMWPMDDKSRQLIEQASQNPRLYQKLLQLTSPKKMR